jgi:hypothetical protein
MFSISNRERTKAIHYQAGLDSHFVPIEGTSSSDVKELFPFIILQMDR